MKLIITLTHSSLIGFLLLISAWLNPLQVRAQHKADDILGKWVTEPKEGSYAHIEIYKSGNQYNGRIIWLSVPEENGKPKTDKRNPDDKKKSRPLLGLDLLSGFEFDGKSEWENGTIYDPSSGDTYKCFMWLENMKVLKVKGYIGISLIGKTATWKRLEEKN